MRILHIIPALESGGVERGTIDLATTLVNAGETVIVISGGGRLVKDLEDNGIIHIKLPVGGKSPLALFYALRVASIIKSHKIEIVHASSRVPAWIGFIACRLTRAAFVTSCHGFYSRQPLSYVMGWGKLVMVISEAIRRRMKDAFGVPEEKIRLVPRGLDLSRYLYSVEKYERDKNFFTVINVARLTPLKGQREFIRAMKRVLEKNRNVETQIVGGAQNGKEHYLAELRDLVGRLGIKERVGFLGLRADVPELLKKADCLVLSTNVPEGFGRTVIEAGAVGTAVCASETGGIKEIIEDGVSGLLFPPGDEAKMAGAILRMLSDAELRKKCAANLRRKVEESFTLDKMASRTLAVYKEALRL